MQEPTPCEFPTKRAGTGYQYGCRCDRCRAGWADDQRRTRLRSAGLLVVECACGAPLPKKHSKYCSDACKPAHQYERVEPRLFTCDMVACHNLCASSHRDARYCSESCSQVAKNARRRGTPEALAHPPHWLKSQPVAGPTLGECDVTSWPVLGPTLNDWPLFQPVSAPTHRQCETCRKWFNGTGLACSRLCSDQYHKIVKTNASTPIATGHCRRCAKPYVRPASHDASGCCSPECTRRLRRSVQRRARRARKRSQVHEPYTLREIADRDGWRCHLCGGKVPDRKYAARDKDPTIDHLIPQSAGGDDTRVNVALAHNRCNWERGNQGLAQLRLAG